jgi:hypothetical protein
MVAHSETGSKWHLGNRSALVAKDLPIPGENSPSHRPFTSDVPPSAYLNAYAWSGRVPLDPLLADEISFIQTTQAGVRVVPSGDPRTARVRPILRTPAPVTATRQPW